MELVIPQEVNKPRNVNRFKKGLEKSQMPDLSPVVEERFEGFGCVPNF